MANYFDQFDGTGASGTSAKNYFDQFDAPKDDPPKPQSRTLGEAGGDFVRGLASGVGALVKGGGQLYGLASGNMDNAATRLGDSVQDYWREGQSDYLKGLREDRSQRVEAADGELAKFGTAAWETIKNPALLSDFAAENISMLIPSGLAGRGAAMAATKLGAKAATAGRIGKGAAIGTGAVQQGAEVAGGQYERAMDAQGTPQAVWDANPEYRRRIAGGESPDAVKHDMALTSARLAFPMAAGVSALTQAIPGGAKVEEALAGISSRTVGRGANVLRSAVGEGAQEALEESGGAFTANIAQRGIDPNQRLSEGTGEAGGMALVGGGVLGAGAGVLQRVSPLAQPVAAEKPSGDALDEAIRQQFAAQHRMDGTTRINSTVLGRAWGVPAKDVKAAARRVARDFDPAAANEVRESHITQSADMMASDVPTQQPEGNMTENLRQQQEAQMLADIEAAETPEDRAAAEAVLADFQQQAAALDREVEDGNDVAGGAAPAATAGNGIEAGGAPIPGSDSQRDRSEIGDAEGSVADVPPDLAGAGAAPDAQSALTDPFPDAPVGSMADAANAIAAQSRLPDGSPVPDPANGPLSRAVADAAASGAIPTATQPTAPAPRPAPGGVVPPVTPPWVNEATGEVGHSTPDLVRQAVQRQMLAQYQTDGTTGINRNLLAEAWGVSAAGIGRAHRELQRTFDPEAMAQEMAAPAKARPEPARPPSQEPGGTINSTETDSRLIEETPEPTGNDSRVQAVNSQTPEAPPTGGTFAIDEAETLAPQGLQPTPDVKPSAQPQSEAGSPPGASTAGVAAHPKTKLVNGVRRYVTNAPETLAAYFQPGRVIKSYGGWDRVLGFQPTGPDGQWAVQVVAVNEDGSPKPGESPRWHNTEPTRAELTEVLGNANQAYLAEKQAKAATPKRGKVSKAKPQVKGNAESLRSAGDVLEKSQELSTSGSAAEAGASGEMRQFPVETGTLGIPRDEMPQVPAQSHGALVNHLNAQGIGHETTTVDAGSLKPTQAEYSPERVEKAKTAKGERSVIVSNDGHIIDGHHQALAAAEQGEQVKAIVLDAPVEQALEAVKNSPSAADGQVPNQAPKAAADGGNTQNPDSADPGSGEAVPLQDFGQVLEGARKFLPPSLKEELGDDQIANQPLSKIWPANAHESIGDDTIESRTDPETGNVGLFSRPESRSLDAEYLAAVERGDMETAQRMVNEAAARAGYQGGADHRMSHRAPNSADGVNLADVRTSGLVPDDYWTHPHLYMADPRERAAMSQLQQLFRSIDARAAAGKPPGLASITVYRAVPKSVKEDRIRNGDWVTPSEAYARDEGAQIPGGYRIISQQASARNLWWDGNSAAELGYDDGEGYAYRNTKNNRKLLDAVTRDDAGNVIPLSRRFQARNDDPRFSRPDQAGPAYLTTATDVQAAVRQVLDGWKGDKPVVRVVQTANELPADAKRDEGWQQAEGYWDGGSAVYIVAGNSRDVARALEVLSHEAIGHYGIEKVLGEKEWTRLVADVKRLRGLKQSDVSPKIWQVLQSAKRRYGQESDVVFAKEFLAIMAEQGVRSGLTARVAAAIRQFLAKLGIPVNIGKTFREAELLAALHAGRQRVTQGERGARQPSGRQPARAMAFSRQPDAANLATDTSTPDVRDLTPEQVKLLQSLGMLSNEQADLLEDGSADAEARSAARRVLRDIAPTMTKAEIDAKLAALAQVKARLQDLPPAVRVPNIDGEMTPELKAGMIRLGYFLQGFTQDNPDAFDYGQAPKGEKDIQKIADAMLGDQRPIPTFTKGETDAKGVQHWTIRSPDGREGTFEVEPGGVLQLHIGDFLKNSGQGSALYAVFNTWAARNGYKALPDRAGLSEVNKYRRTASMLSSALREGSTAHLMPHPDQNLPHWVRGKGANTAAFNIGYMALREAKRVLDPKTAKLRIHLLDRVRYDFDQHQFVDSKGRGISLGEYRAVLSQAAAGQGAVGRRSAQRASFAATAWAEIERRGLSTGRDARAWGTSAAHAGAQSGVRALADPAGHAERNPDALVLDGPLTMQRGYYSRPDPNPETPALAGVSASVGQRLTSAVRNTLDAVDKKAGRGPDKRPDWVSDSVAGKFDTFSGKKPTKQWFDELRERAGEKLSQRIFDQYRSMRGYSEEGFMQAHLSRATDGTLDTVFNNGIPILKDGAYYIDEKNGGLKGLMVGLGSVDEMQRFFMWVAGNRSERLATEGRENLFTPDDIKEMKAYSTGKLPDGRDRAKVYKETLAKFNQFQRAILDIAERAGEIDPESRKLWESEFYIPYYRVAEETGQPFSPGGAGLARQNVVKKLKGGTEKLGDPLENVLSNWSAMLSASMRNMAANKTLNEATRLGAAERVPAGTKGSTWTMVDGRKQHWLVHDKLLAESLEAMNFQGYKNPVMKWAGKFKRMLSVGVTVNPSYRIRNLTRDIVSALATADTGDVSAANPLRSLAVLGTNLKLGKQLTERGSDTDIQLSAGGGAVRFGLSNDGDQAANTKKLIAMGINENQILDAPGKFKNALRRAWDKYQELGDRAETMSRAVIYDRAIKAGKSHLQASFEARDLMNFTSMGSSAAVRALAQVLPFFNARLQGLDKLGRAAKNDPRRFWAVAGHVAMASALLYMLQGDDEEYQALPDYVRDTYWPVKLGGTWVYIPKPFELGSLGTVVERGAELMMAGDDYQAKDFRDSMVSILTNTLAMNPVPQIIKPVGEAWFNYDMFRNAPIDSMAQQRLLPQDRFTARTSGAAVLAGQAAGVSPQKIEHMVKGYFGWLGIQALNVGDLLARDAAGLPSNPNRDMTSVNNWFVVGDFAKESGSTPSKYMERFYESQKELDQIYATATQARKAGDTERALELLNDPILRTRPAFQAADRRITRINQSIRSVTADRSLSATEKNRRLENLRKQREEVAKRVDRLARAAG